MGLVLLASLTVGARGRPGPPTEEQRVKRIASAVRCPTCRSLSAEQSEAPLSGSIRDEIRRRVVVGETDGHIRDYLVSRYGKSILLSPDTTGVSFFVWALPLLVAALAVAGLVLAVRRKRARTSERVTPADEALVEKALRSLAAFADKPANPTSGCES